MHLPLIKIAALLSTAVSFTIVSASPNAHSGHLVLRAAKRHGGLVARSDTVVLRNDLTLTYAEGIFTNYPIQDPLPDPVPRKAASRQSARFRAEDAFRAAFSVA
jgi:hypothetical protein